MFLIASRNLLQEKTRLLISVIGVAFSVILIVFLVGVYQGLNIELGKYIATIPSDLWVAQEGSKNLYDSTSVLPAAAQPDIEAVEGVASVKPFQGRQAAVEVNGKEYRAFVVATGEGSPAQPPNIVEGTADMRSGEIILDRVVTGAKLGQEVTVGGKPFTVAGITEGGNVLIVSYAFVMAEDAVRLFRSSEVVNYFVVETEDGADTSAVAAAIESAVPDSKVRGVSEFVENSISVVKEVFLPIISILSLIGGIVGMTVIGLTIYTSVLEKRREYGVLKALGIRNGQLYKIVLQQSLLTSVLGYAVGGLMAFGLMSLATRLAPAFIAEVRPIDMGWLFVATLLMGGLAAFLPARRLTKIDPAEVFKS
ncbi:MAG TPA: FtsX-like permease family protein [Patescibacteria group bacterium]